MTKKKLFCEKEVSTFSVLQTELAICEERGFQIFWSVDSRGWLCGDCYFCVESKRWIHGTKKAKSERRFAASETAAATPDTYRLVRWWGLRFVPCRVIRKIIIFIYRPFGGFRKRSAALRRVARVPSFPHHSSKDRLDITSFMRHETNQQNQSTFYLQIVPINTQLSTLLKFSETQKHQIWISIINFILWLNLKIKKTHFKMFILTCDLTSCGWTNREAEN